MRIIRLEAENVKRLRAVDITPDGNVVTISGRNGQGKTSVLDAIWLALAGKSATKDTSRPIRDGAESARVQLELEEIVVTRTWTEKGTQLKVESAGGTTRFNSPQAMLDGLIGALSFDPLAFAHADPKDQLKTLLGLVQLPFDPEDLALERREVFDERTIVNWSVKQLAGQLAGMPAPPADLPDAELSAGDIVADIRAAEAHAAENERVTREWTAACEDVPRHEAEVARLREALADAEARLEEAVARCEGLGAAVEALEPAPSTADLEAKLADLEATNAAVRDAAARRRVAEALRAAEEESQALTDRLASIDASKAEALAAAELPVDGLGFDDEGVTYNGVPFQQASAAEQLRVSVAMAMALNPEIRVIRITDGSLLDSGNLALIAEMADEHDFQVWIEKVDESGTIGVYIEDGVVAAVNPS